MVKVWPNIGPVKERRDEEELLKKVKLDNKKDKLPTLGKNKL